MAVQLDLSNMPQSAQLEVSIHLSAPLRVTAAEARRRVSRLVISEVGNLLYGGEPTLAIGERICWHVPVLLGYPDVGVVGQVGVLDVDVETGAVLVTPEQLTALFDYALYLAERTASPTA
ncbi:MAG: hypothetical protein IPK16_29065 [Anaerolineales bacterium]|nr:hypothetical protein [Anaerolineales bacterium]